MDDRKVVPFKTDLRISHDLTEWLLRKGKLYGLKMIFPFDIEKIIVADWVHLKCRYGCKRYNTSWCCPPATPNPDRVRAILSEYSTALLLVGRKSCFDFYLDNDRKRITQVRCWKSTILLERMLFLQGYYKAFSLISECCALCKICAYPYDCRFPQEKRPSVEAFSVDIFGTLKNLYITPKVAKQKYEEYSYYSLILLE